jgi:hypothetical protein
VDISWDKQEGVAAYEIRRSDTSTGASPYLLDTVRGNQNWYRNKIAEVEQGRDFYYMVTAVNSFGNKSLQTKPAYGYAKVFGAPDTPETVELDEGSGRGNSKSEIKIKWSECDGAEYYAVYRYSSIDSSLTRLTENTANPFWADSQGLRPGIYYYYQVQSIKNDIITGKVLKSEMSSAEKAPEGFLLSPPATVVAEKNASSGAIRLKWLPAIGGDGERGNYTYKVYADNSLEGNYADCVLSGIAPAADAEGYISTDGDALAGKTFFKIATVNGALESAKGGAVSPVPAAAEIIDASQHALIAGSPAANSNGVYPVRITWKKPANEVPAFYHVQRSSSAGSGFSQINSEALGANGPWNADYSYDEASGVYTYLDRNASAKAGKKYFYRVLSLNQLGQGNFPSAEKVGYGALTHTQYMLEYNKTMKAALKKLTYMHKPGSTEKLGTETKNGTLGGTIYYNAAIAGLGARIIIEVKDYAEFYIENDASRGQYFVLTGNSNTSANMSSNGTMDGTVTCTGMYPGKISYDRIEIKGGAAGGGTYGVTPDGFPEDSVDWKVGNQ